MESIADKTKIYIWNQRILTYLVFTFFSHHLYKQINGAKFN